jgi:choloylglycine hydrolase
MDFRFELDGKPVVVPRNFQFDLQLCGKLNMQYGFVGDGHQIEDGYFFAGVNEKGLAIAELYYLNESEYSVECDDNKLNLALYEFILYGYWELLLMLMNCMKELIK